MLRDVLGGISPDRALKAEWCRGTPPPGQLGWRKARRSSTGWCNWPLRRCRCAPNPRAVDVDIELGACRRLAGTVSPVYGAHLVSVTYSKLDGKHLLAAWIPLLALAAHMPGTEWSAVCIGRGKGRGGPRTAHLALPEVPAAELLKDLVAIYDAGRREPLPLPLKTSFAWADARHNVSIRSTRPASAGGRVSIRVRTRSRPMCAPGERARPWTI